jgi:hypothetical protein
VRAALAVPRFPSPAHLGKRRISAVTTVPRAVAAGRELARLAPTLRRQCLLAEELLEVGNAAEARELLERSLRDHEYAPGPTRRRNSRWASEARRL